jgi:hypothetical protein
MTYRLLTVLLVVVATCVHAQDRVVFSMGDAVAVSESASRPRLVPAEAEFSRSVARSIMNREAFDVAYPLINPPQWGRVVSRESSGRLEIRRVYRGGLLLRMAMTHMEPAHRYALCINGRPLHLGNDLLPQPVPGNPDEKYYDFATVDTDGRGSCTTTIGLWLRPGAYNVHFYVKDTTDHKIVLYGLEYFDFTVR